MEGSSRSSEKRGLTDQSVFNSQFSLLSILGERWKENHCWLLSWLAPLYMKTCYFFLLKNMVSWSYSCIFTLILTKTLNDYRIAVLSARQSSISSSFPSEMKHLVFSISVNVKKNCSLNDFPSESWLKLSMSSQDMSSSYWQNRCSSLCLQKKANGKIQWGCNGSLLELGKTSRSL